MNERILTIAAETNRFLERLERLDVLLEPIGYVGGQNLFEFVASDPEDLVDPRGTTPVIPGPFILNVAPPTPQDLPGSHGTWHADAKAHWGTAESQRNLNFRLRYTPNDDVANKVCSIDIIQLTQVLTMNNDGVSIGSVPLKVKGEIISNHKGWSIDTDNQASSPFFTQLPGDNHQFVAGAAGDTGKFAQIHDSPYPAYTFDRDIFNFVDIAIVSHGKYGGLERGFVLDAVEWGFIYTENGIFARRDFKSDPKTIIRTGQAWSNDTGDAINNWNDNFSPIVPPFFWK